ncbi:molybdenum cofactor biosynthesis protein MoaE [bacterium]|nr:molybdenum cofactor biosynthesis protein MoaE [bacterium]
MIRLTSEPILVDDLVRAAGDPASGALVLFVGTTRDHNQGRQVERLEYEAYPGMAEREMEKIADEARRRWPLQKVAIVHRTGVVPVGEASVAIAVSSAHRADAFEAARFAIDRLKEVVPIWKKEFFEGGEIWIGDQCCGVGAWSDAEHAHGANREHAERVSAAGNRAAGRDGHGRPQPGAGPGTRAGDDGAGSGAAADPAKRD